MTSDFPRAAARVSEGFCPLCDGSMQYDVTDDVRSCRRCRVDWSLTKLDDGRLVIQTDRRLTPPEIRALYARPEEGDG